MAYNEFDSIQPNTQTPGSSFLGTTANPWDTIIGTTVSGTTLGATTVYAGGNQLARLYTATVDLVGGVALTVTHGLNNSNPIIQVYGSGTNHLLTPGLSGLPAGYIASLVYMASGTSANAVQITANSGVAGAKVVILG